MFPITVTISNTDQLKAVMQALNVGVAEPTKASPCVGHAVETAKATAEKAATTAVKAEATTADVESPAYKAAKDAVVKFARDHGRDAAVQLLQRFGASKLPEVKPEQLADVTAACEKAGV